MMNYLGGKTLSDKSVKSMVRSNVLGERTVTRIPTLSGRGKGGVERSAKMARYLLAPKVPLEDL